MDNKFPWCTFLALIILFFHWGCNSKFRYSMQYRTGFDNILIDPKPKNCDFLHAPIGDKSCSYEKIVSASDYQGKTIVVVSYERVDK